MLVCPIITIKLSLLTLMIFPSKCIFFICASSYFHPHLQGKIDVAYAMYDYKGKFECSQGLFKKREIDVLSENWIVAKALQAFTHNGTIPKVFCFSHFFQRALISKSSLNHNPTV